MSCSLPTAQQIKSALGLCLNANFSYNFEFSGMRLDQMLEIKIQASTWDQIRINIWTLTYFNLISKKIFSSKSPIFRHFIDFILSLYKCQRQKEIGIDKLVLLKALSWKIHKKSTIFSDKISLESRTKNHVSSSPFSKSSDLCAVRSERNGAF